MMPVSMLQPVRVRFAPSPTGNTHLGSARTALYNYLIARQSGGQFILRIEDTDQKRYVPGAEAELIDSLHWLGLDWDEGPDVGGSHAPYRQSERREIYQQHARQLIDQGHAYCCFCSPERLARVRQEQQKNKQLQLYDGLCRKLDPDEAYQRIQKGEKYVVRFKMLKTGSIRVQDLLRGEIEVENHQLDDFILIKSDGLAVYHLAAMVDDHLMGITHVIRGAEWLSTFPLHAHIIRAFGWTEPTFVHLSLFLKPSGKGKMSKREAAQLMQDGYSIFVKDLMQLGYLPEAVVNWIALMGWSYDDHTEFFKLPDLIEKFNLAKLNPSPAAINFTKFDHFNGLHIRNLDMEDLARRVKPFFEAANYTVDETKLKQIVPIIRERIVTLEDAVDMAGFFFRDQVYPTPADLVGTNMTAKESAETLQKVSELLVGLDRFEPSETEEMLRKEIQDWGLTAGQVFGILRSAVTGQKVSPPLMECMAIIGKQKVLERIQEAIEILEHLPSGG